MASISPELRQLDQVEYDSGVSKWLLALGMGICFVVAFLSHFPLEERVQRLVKAQLAQLPGCSGRFERLQFEFMLPKALISDVTLPASCFGRSGAPLVMRHLTLRFAGPSFAPLGLAFTVEGDVNGQPLTIRSAVGMGTQVISLHEEALNLAKLAGALPGLPRLEGTLKLNAKVTLQDQQLEDLQLLAESQNLTVPAQALGDFRLPRLALGTLGARVRSEGPRRLLVEELFLGRPDAPVRMKFSGTVDAVPEAMAQSRLNLKGEATFSPEFQEAFPILNLMLPQFSQKDGFYQIRLAGTLGAPQPSSL